ncbi:GNAT family N-acetyltransferase [Bacillus sp. DTU_2020_1000418_1_SI_GHA_SEK_038]|uniref:GNAT family N-acetyltransferase n=1 Tax=Bacillus sp. DTU_2020_1000418_1_SI_GHA_SEK_038 TaxID=3077585 RepID=UPI0028EA991D|nr:GNAT family N-acetyltransferase [Bacillus sp. DTU_2020_1000418_1_SI_GHA_SEK_038]WNS74787.1 GNAT family N-acetyltransferase [Bacillus sp. DTU_2020_1000418_1_SI_GHA_SEK_038]
MSIVKATLNDLESVTELFDLYRIFYKQNSDIEGAREFIKERLTSEDSVIFIAFEDENPVGFVQLYPSFSSVSMKRLWVLNDLYVKESVRGKGLGENLMKKAIAFAEETGAKGVLLETATDNFGAQKLYEKLGFIKETNYFYYFSL